MPAFRFLRWWDGRMAICYAEPRIEALPPEPRLLEEVTVRLVETESERRRHDELLVQKTR